MILGEHELSLPQLRCFVTVAEAQSLAAAGRRLGMSAASMSKAIARLEDAVGVRVLNRSTHGFTLTVEGEALLAPAREVLAAAAGFRQAAAGGADGGTIRISAPVGFCRVVLAPLLARFRQEQPAIHLDVRASNDIVPLAESGIDLALRTGSLARTPGHVQQRWFRFPWVICAAPAYLERRGMPGTVAELAGHDLVAFRNLRTGQIQPWPIRDDHGPGRLTPAPGLAFDDGDSGWQATLAGAGIACSPLWMAAAALRDGRIMEVLREARGELVDVSIIRPDRRLTPPRITALLDFLLANPPMLDDLG